MPGPGEYEITSGLTVKNKKPMSMFTSKVQRNTVSSVNARNKSLSTATKNIKSSYALVQSQGASSTMRPNT